MGAWFPLALAGVVMAISTTWHWAFIKRMRYNNEHARPLTDLLRPVLDEPDNGHARAHMPSQYQVIL
jgi:K+ transporter